VSLWSRDVAVDLGTTNVLVYVQGRGIVIREPAVVAINSKDGSLLAVGEEARDMVGRTPGEIIAVQPLRDGVIANFEMTEAMLAYFIRRALQRRSFIGFSPRAIVCVPCEITDVEKRAVEEATRKAGVREAYIAEELMAAAIGAGLPVGEACGSLVVDLGGGTSEAAVISYGGIVVYRSIRIGGIKMDETIVAYIKREYNVLIGERTAEELKINLGSAVEPKINNVMAVKGRNLTNGLPVTIEVSTRDVREALMDILSSLADMIRSTLEVTPPELASDIMERGIVLTGGGALMQGLDMYIYRETGIPTLVAENPLDCVAQGAGRMLDHLDDLLKGRR
jgi:rod shape-determining protein MreB and related proteins